jgi:hypothetical protein
MIMARNDTQRPREPSNLRKQHAEAFKTTAEHSVKNNWPGADASETVRLLCWVDRSIRWRDVVLDAISRRCGHKIGHSQTKRLSCRLRGRQQAQYSESVADNAPVAQLDRASAF